MGDHLSHQLLKMGTTLTTILLILELQTLKGVTLNKLGLCNGRIIQ